LLTLHHFCVTSPSLSLYRFLLRLFLCVCMCVCVCVCVCVYRALKLVLAEEQKEESEWKPVLALPAEVSDVVSLDMEPIEDKEGEVTQK